MAYAMRAAPRKYANDEIVVALEMFWIDAGNGNDRLIAKGDTLRGDDPAVRTSPNLFAPATSTTAELTAARQALQEHGIAISMATEESRRAEESKRRPEIPVDRQLRVRQAFILGVGGRSFGEGELVDRGDPAIAKILEKHRAYFEVPARPA